MKYINCIIGIIYFYCAYHMSSKITAYDESLNFIGSAVTYPMDTFVAIMLMLAGIESFIKVGDSK